MGFRVFAWRPCVHVDRPCACEAVCVCVCMYACTHTHCTDGRLQCMLVHILGQQPCCTYLLCSTYRCRRRRPRAGSAAGRRPSAGMRRGGRSGAPRSAQPPHQGLVGAGVVGVWVVQLVTVVVGVGRGGARPMVPRVAVAGPHWTRLQPGLRVSGCLAATRQQFTRAPQCTHVFVSHGGRASTREYVTRVHNRMAYILYCSGCSLRTTAAHRTQKQSCPFPNFNAHAQLEDLGAHASGTCTGSRPVPLAVTPATSPGLAAGAWQC